MSVPLAEGARYPVLLGNVFTVALPAGQQLRVSRRMDDGTDTDGDALTADADGVSYEPNKVGRYYLAWRRSSAEPWCPAGVIDCNGLVDDEEERLVAELEGVNGTIAEARASLIQYQISDPSGTAATRVTLRTLQRTRADLEIRLQRHRTRRRGGLPVRVA